MTQPSRCPQSPADQQRLKEEARKVMFRPSLATCEQRAAARPEGKIADYSQYRDFYTMFEGLPNHEVGDVEANARSIARRIRAGLDEGIFRLD